MSHKWTGEYQEDMSLDQLIAELQKAKENGADSSRRVTLGTSGFFCTVSRVVVECDGQVELGYKEEMEV